MLRDARKSGKDGMLSGARMRVVAEVCSKVLAVCMVHSAPLQVRIIIVQVASINGVHLRSNG